MSNVVAAAVAVPAQSAGSSFAQSLDGVLLANNWKIHQRYVAKEFEACLDLIESVLQSTYGQCEFAVYTKGLIRRQQGRIDESLELFQAATALNPTNIDNLKQVGRSLFLLGRFESCIQIYEEAEKLGADTWDAWHNKGMCYWKLNRLNDAVECLQNANSIQRHDVTFDILGKVHMQMKDLQKSAAVYTDALEFSPDNPKTLATLGLLYLQLGENSKSFDSLGNSLTHDPSNSRAILAAGSIIQDHQDTEVALTKYRIAATKIPTCAQLWNNIGMCFYAKRKCVAAISTLKRAQYLDPFEWIIAYNLGICHLATHQYASAFHHLSAAININPDFARSYMFLGIALSHLGDHDNTMHAFAKAFELDRLSFHAHLNLAIIYFNMGDMTNGKKEYASFQEMWSRVDESVKKTESDIHERLKKIDEIVEQ